MATFTTQSKSAASTWSNQSESSTSWTTASPSNPGLTFSQGSLIGMLGFTWYTDTTVSGQTWANQSKS